MSTTTIWEHATPPARKTLRRGSIRAPTAAPRGAVPRLKIQEIRGKNATLNAVDDSHPRCEPDGSDGRSTRDTRSNVSADIDEVVAATAEDDEDTRWCDTRPDLGAVEDVLLMTKNATKQSARSQTIDITVDPGAAEVVAPLTLRRGSWHRTASWAIAAKQGEQRIPMSTDDGHVRMMTFQIAGMAKSLAPAGPNGKWAPCTSRRDVESSCMRNDMAS